MTSLRSHTWSFPTSGKAPLEIKLDLWKTTNKEGTYSFQLEIKGFGHPYTAPDCRYAGPVTSNPALLPAVSFLQKKIHHLLKAQLHKYALENALSWGMENIKVMRCGYNNMSASMDFNPNWADTDIHTHAQEDKITQFADSLKNNIEALVPEITQMINENRDKEPPSTPDEAVLTKFGHDVQTAFEMALANSQNVKLVDRGKDGGVTASRRPQSRN